MGSPAAVAHLRRLGAPPAVMRVFAVFLGLRGGAHIAGTSDSFTRAADGESVDYLAGAWTLPDPRLLRAIGVVWAFVVIALWSSVVGVVIDVAVLAVAVRAGVFSRAGAKR